MVGVYQDYGVKVPASPFRTVINAPVFGSLKPVPKRSVQPPASIVGMVKRWNEKYRTATRLQIDAIERFGAFDRCRYWNRQAEKWFRKSHALITKHPEYKINWPLK